MLPTLVLNDDYKKFGWVAADASFASLIRTGSDLEYLGT